MSSKNLGPDFFNNGNQNSPTREQIQFTSVSHLSPNPLWANDHFQPENYEQMTIFNLRTMSKWPFSTWELWANDHFQPENYEQMTIFNPRTDLCGQKTAWKGAGTKSTDHYDCRKLDQTPFPVFSDSALLKRMMKETWPLNTSVEARL